MKEKRSLRIKITNNRREHHLLCIRENYDPYWDEGITFYPKHRPGFKNTHWRAQLMSYQVRMYKTWKHNRKTQWKS